MPSPERQGQGVSPPPERRPRRKEIPQFNVLERICKGVEVVEVTTRRRKYHVVWERDTNQLVHSFFDNLQKVLNQHERVIEGYLGTEIPLVAEQLLQIPGETQKMAGLSGRLSTLGARYLIPLSPQDSAALKNEIEASSRELGQVTNRYKRIAKTALESAILASEKGVQVDRVLEANLAILERNKECLMIVQGTLARFRIVSRQRDEWERIVEKRFGEMAVVLSRLERGDLTNKDEEQIARQISGTRYGAFMDLSKIPGPEYWQRMQSREIQNLVRFGDLLRKGDKTRAKRILRSAIFKLERVVKERRQREKTKVQK